MTTAAQLSRPNAPPAEPPQLSVVLPCYRAAALARRSVAELREFLDLGHLTWEIVVVDDGGGDFGDEPLSDDPRVRLLVLPVNRGKGGAVAAGMLAARGDARVFTDVDLPYDLHLLIVSADYLLERRFHVVIGDRTMPAASYTNDIGWRRRLASRMFSTFVGKLVTGGFFDTQCGLKGFRGDVASVIFELSRLTRFAFDVELVYLSLVHGLDIKRVPVRLRNDATSSIRIVRDSARMFFDVFRIKYHQMRGDYRDTRLSTIVFQDFLDVLSGSPTGDTARAVFLAKDRCASADRPAPVAAARASAAR